jgi:hypothetical protein
MVQQMHNRAIIFKVLFFMALMQPLREMIFYLGLLVMGMRFIHTDMVCDMQNKFIDLDDFVVGIDDILSLNKTIQFICSH